MKQLVLVHGRSQHHKDAAALKAEWLESLAAGLDDSKLTLPIAETDVRFPFYGDTLFDLVAGKPAGEAADVIIKGPQEAAKAQQRDFIHAIATDLQESAGITDDQVRAELGVAAVEKGPQNWEWVQGILSAIDRHVPFGSSTAIALFTNDVFHYLRSIGTRDKIESGVRAAIKPGVPTVVVGHSLGSVVAYSLLRREGAANGWDIPLFVTLGSPLAVKAIRDALAPIAFPECAGEWFNAMDKGDIVSLHPLDSTNFDVEPAIVNKTDVRNFTANRHGIAGYLQDPEVARRIHDALA